MTTSTPTWTVPPTPTHWDLDDPFAAGSWRELPSLPDFLLADGSGPAEQQTAVRLCWDARGLYVRFDCADRDAWGSYSQRDDPLWREEAVELFLAPDQAVPTAYYELEVSPAGTLFDARVHNPAGDRDGMTVDRRWDCPGLRWRTGRTGRSEDWWAVLAIPWHGVTPTPEDRPRLWRANFYRIERPHDGATELSCWSPTLTDPPDFHRPARFGLLRLRDVTHPPDAV